MNVPWCAMCHHPNGQKNLTIEINPMNFNLKNTKIT